MTLILREFLDPLGQPKSTCRPYVVRTYVRLYFSNLEKQNNRKQTIGLAEWIIDDTCLFLVYIILMHSIIQIE